MTVEPDKEDRQQNATFISNALSLGFNMVVGMIVFSGLGYWLDQRSG